MRGREGRSNSALDAATAETQKCPLAKCQNLNWALVRSGIDNFRWHDLRHTWATWQRQAGTPTDELQRLGGWRTGAMVERYAHLAPDHLAEAASRLNSVLTGYDPATVA
ncbi:MAG TPA: tyrosine-type recombinase/integrase [Azonexus sp.]|nr:tyrosine-type recombinase/integrase [Azonexus sp.]